MSHNIKIVSIYLRYLLGIVIFVAIIIHYLSPIWLMLGIIVYMFWAYQKSNLLFSNWKVGVWGIVLQIVSDFSIMYGFLQGMIHKRE